MNSELITKTNKPTFTDTLQRNRENKNDFHFSIKFRLYAGSLRFLYERGLAIRLVLSLDKFSPSRVEVCLVTIHSNSVALLGCFPLMLYDQSKRKETRISQAGTRFETGFSLDTYSSSMK